MFANIKLFKFFSIIALVFFFNTSAFSNPLIKKGIQKVGKEVLDEAWDALNDPQNLDPHRNKNKKKKDGDQLDLPFDDDSDTETVRECGFTDFSVRPPKYYSAPDTPAGLKKLAVDSCRVGFLSHLHDIKHCLSDIIN